MNPFVSGLLIGAANMAGITLGLLVFLGLLKIRLVRALLDRISDSWGRHMAGGIVAEREGISKDEARRLLADEQFAARGAKSARAAKRAP